MSEASEPRRSLLQRIGLARADAQAYYERGLLSFAAHKADDALADLDAALQIAPGFAELYSARGLILLEAGKLPESQEDFEYALKLNGRQWLAQYGLGVLAFNRKAWAEAIEAFTKAQAIAPGRPEPWYYRAVAYYNAGEMDKGRADMKIALKWLAGDKKRGDDAKKWLKTLGADDTEIEAVAPSPAKPAERASKRSDVEASEPAKQSEKHKGVTEVKEKSAPESSEPEETEEEELKK